MPSLSQISKGRESKEGKGGGLPQMWQKVILPTQSMP
jgi:hypothetical protein